MEPDIDLDELERKIQNSDFPSNPWNIILSLIAEVRELKKGKTNMGNHHLPKSLGTYEFVKSTSRFHVYSRENEKGIKESIYVYKGHFEPDEKPAKIEFFMKY